MNCVIDVNDFELRAVLGGGDIASSPGYASAVDDRVELGVIPGTANLFLVGHALTHHALGACVGWKRANSLGNSATNSAPLRACTSNVRSSWRMTRTKRSMAPPRLLAAPRRILPVAGS